MENNIIKSASSSNSPFDSILRVEDDRETWYARELMPILGYQRWENFNKIIEKAICSCQNVGSSVPESFCVIMRTSDGRSSKDYRLSRYACYLVAMNGDPSKPEIAAAQSYFAIKTREAEVVNPAQIDRIRELELKLAIAKSQERKTEIEASRDRENKDLRLQVTRVQDAFDSMYRSQNARIEYLEEQLSQSTAPVAKPSVPAPMAWYTINELRLAKAPGIPKSNLSIQKIADKQNWERRMQRRKRGGGWEYSVLSMPIETQQYLATRNRLAIA